MKNVDALVQEVMTERQVPGVAVGVVRGDVPLLLKGYGYANVEHQVPVTVDTLFGIASVTKLFTGTAVFQLIEQGKLKLTDTIGQHLPSLPKAWQPITIHHLLAHQSGIKSYTEVAAYWETTRLDISRKQILALVADLPLQFEPGERYAYDNTGYYLLGLLIEAVSGQSYGDFLRQHIFTPLGMTQTRPNDPYAIVPNRAAGYTVNGSDLQNAEYYSPSGTYSAGVLLSSVHDLAQFAQALYTDKLLSAESRELMWTVQLSQAQNELKMQFQMGYSWFYVMGGKRPFYGHNGGMVGFNSAFLHYPDDKTTVIALYNSDTVGEPHALCTKVAEAFLHLQ